MKNILMSIGVYAIAFLYFSFVMLPLMAVFFIPVLPIMLLAFPMIFINEGTGKVHWTQKPYLWYFDNVWLKSLNFLRIG